MKSLRNNLKGTKKVDMKRSQFSSNKNGSLGRLKSLVRDLKQISEIHEAYNTVIQEQVQNKTIERVSYNEISSCKEFYLPHHNRDLKKKLNQQNLRQVFH